MTLYADSSAALAIAKREAAGKLRHIHVSSLWIQDVQDREETEFKKILGTLNPPDLMTKYLSRDKIGGAWGGFAIRKASNCSCISPRRQRTTAYSHQVDIEPGHADVRIFAHHFWHQPAPP